MRRMVGSGKDEMGKINVWGEPNLGFCGHMGMMEL